MSDNIVPYPGQTLTLYHEIRDSNLPSTFFTFDETLQGEVGKEKYIQEIHSEEQNSEYRSFEETNQRQVQNEQNENLELIVEGNLEFKYQSAKEQDDEEEKKQENPKVETRIVEESIKEDEDDVDGDGDGDYSSQGSDWHDFAATRIEDLFMDVFMGQGAIQFSKSDFMNTKNTILNHPEILDHVKAAFEEGFTGGTTIAYILAVDLNKPEHNLPYLVGSLLKKCKENKINIILIQQEVIEVLIYGHKYTHITRLAQFMKECFEDETMKYYFSILVS